jgi:hypothetical protein
MSTALKVPAILASSLVCLALGIFVGAVGAAYFGFAELKTFWPGAAAKAEAGEQVAALPPMKGMPVGKGGMGGGGMGGMGKGPSAKAQLSALIAKLDALTAKPLAVNLDDEQKKKVQEQLDGLAGLDELAEDEARKRLDGLLDVLKDQRETLSAAGYRWPSEKGGGFGGGGFGGAKESANPFKDEPGAKHLEALERRLGKTAS